MTDTTIEGTAKDVTVVQQQAPPTVTVDKLKVLGNALGSDLNAAELVLFAEVANRSGLDPFAKQIYAVKRLGKVSFQTGIDGYRSIAARTGEYDGQDAPEYGEMQPYPYPHPEWCIVRVYRKGMGRGVAATAYWDEYVPVERDQFMWKRMPRVMLAKVAEAQALRKAFPYVYGGLYTDDEMAQAGPMPAAPGTASSAAPAPHPVDAAVTLGSPSVAAAPGPSKGTTMYAGPVIATPDGIRMTASGRKLEFAIKVVNSKHNVELWNGMADAVFPHVKEGVQLRVDGTRIEEDYPDRGNKPFKKIIKDVALVLDVDTGTVLADRSTPAPVKAAVPAAVEDEGPPVFDDFDTLPYKPAPTLMTGQGDVDQTGQLQAIRWEMTPAGKDFLYLEILDVDANAYARIAMSKEDGDTVKAKVGDTIRVVGGWNKPGTAMLVSGVQKVGG